MPPGDDDRDAPDPPMTVAMLSQRIEAALAQGLPANIRVEGEVANAVVRNSHQYFSLREPDASIGCVMWASDAQRCTHDLRDGDRVIAVGSVVHWARAGRTQLRVRRIEPVGEGELLATFRARCDTLREQGYFDPSARKPLPACPRRIAVLTSATGAAVHDVVATAKRRFPACGLLLVDVPVQGPTAAARIAAAIRRVDRAHKSLRIDAIILTRGGGSLEDCGPSTNSSLPRPCIDARCPSSRRSVTSPTSPSPNWSPMLVAPRQRRPLRRCCRTETKHGRGWGWSIDRWTGLFEPASPRQGRE